MEMAPETLSYEEWIAAVVQRPLDMGWTAGGLVLCTVAALVAGFAFGGPAYFAALGPGRYPRIVLALPFLLGAALIFFMLSPIFYFLYERESRKSA
jgi:hypothetical protein